MTLLFLALQILCGILMGVYIATQDWIGFFMAFAGWWLVYLTYELS